MPVIKAEEVRRNHNERKGNKQKFDTSFYRMSKMGTRNYREFMNISKRFRSYCIRGKINLLFLIIQQTINCIFHNSCKVKV